MNAMRVLFVSGHYLPNQVGGVEIYTHDIARELLARGCAVQVLCADAREKGEQRLDSVVDDIYEDVPVRRLNMNWRKGADPARYLYDDPIAGSQAADLIRRFDPSVVHITYPGHLTVSVVFAAQRAGIPVVLSLCDFWCICPRYSLRHADGHICDARVTTWECTKCLAWNAKIYRWPKRFLPDRALRAVLTWVGRQPGLSRRRGLLGMIGDMEGRRQAIRMAFDAAGSVLAVSQYVRDVFVTSGQAPVDRIRVLAQGIPTQAPVVRQAATPESPLRIAFFGRTIWTKGVEVLIQAFGQLSGNVQLTIYGSSGDDGGAYDGNLHELAADDPRIKFAGPYLRQDMGTLLAETDVVVVPSLVPETYCLVAREALMNHVPVVGSRIGAIPEAVIHEVNGLLVEAGNTEELAAALQRLVNDSALRKSLSHYDSPQQTIAQECDELLAIYESLGRAAVTPMEKA